MIELADALFLLAGYGLGAVTAHLLERVSRPVQPPTPTDASMAPVREPAPALRPLEEAALVAEIDRLREELNQVRHRRAQAERAAGGAQRG